MTNPAPPRPNPEGNAGGRFFGGMLMAVGALVALLSGLCSLGFFVVMLSERGGAGALLGGMIMVAIIGGVPFAFGLVIFFVGRNLYRISRPTLPNLAKTFE